MPRLHPIRDPERGLLMITPVTVETLEEHGSTLVATPLSTDSALMRRSFVLSRLVSSVFRASANKTRPHVISSGQGAYLTIGGKDYLNFCSSHYLGFAEEPRLKKAAQDAIGLYSNFDPKKTKKHHFGPSRAHLSAPSHPIVVYALFRAHADRVVVGACNPMM